jgi:signal transduction histidine kinase
MIEAASPGLSSEALELIGRLQMHWYLVVPLMGRSGPIGALTLVMAESGRTLAQRDLVLAEELGARAGIALENARLYQTADDRRRQLDAVLGALAEAVLVFDAHGQLQLANSAAEGMFNGELPANDIELLHLLSPAETNAHGPAPEGEPVEVQVEGTPRWVEMGRYRAARSGAHDEARGPTVVVLRDVTGARAARAARDAFLGVLSHELRTPITTIYGGSELLERGLDEERRNEVMSDIRVEAERLARLVEDLLVMTRIERGTVEISDEPILVQRLLPSVIHAFNGQWPDVKVTLTLSERLSAVRGDPTYVEQVVRNLLTNAVRYGLGEQKGVTVVAEEREGDVCVRVQDQGPGLGENNPEKLFDLFYRTDAARSVPGGAGIGLFVCRNLIEAMGGTIWALMRESGGAEFGFTLPIVESDL